MAPKPERLQFHGESLTMKEWCARLGVSKNAIRERLASGWSVERALSEPAPPKLPRKIGNRGVDEIPEHVNWRGMMDRCFSVKHSDYQNYGGRGITVCEEWRGSEGFFRFLEYIGPKPSPGHSVDRYPNGEGNYEPGNVRWATATEQSRNRSCTRRITLGGRTQCLAEWCSELGISYALAYSRIRRGQSPAAALEWVEATRDLEREDEEHAADRQRVDRDMGRVA